MEFFGKEKSKTPYVVNKKEVWLLVIERFFQFQGYDYLSQSIWITLYNPVFDFVLYFNSVDDIVVTRIVLLSRR